MKTATLITVLIFLATTIAGQQAPREWDAMREDMVAEVRDHMYRVRSYVGRETLGEEVTRSLRQVQRHLFVPQQMQAHAYDDSPLPIGDGQTISQPFIVALMTELLEVGPASKVLELGTGSGYQAAVLANIVRAVYSIEIVAPLAQRASELLAKQGYDNVTVKQGDGTLGWPEHAPFDGIIVTAAGIKIPPPLLDQLKVGGRLVMPVGAQHEVQQLMVITRNEDGSFTEKKTIPVRFVPITGSNR